LLDPEPTERKVWLSADVIERLALYEWPGNVRELRNIALSLSNLRGPRDPLKADDIRGSLRSPTPAAAPELPEEGLKPRHVSPELLAQTLEAVDWGLGAAAERLGISRPSLNELVDAHPTLKRAKFLTDAEIEAGRERADQTGQPLWRELKVSRRALTRRLSGADRASA
jgi:two-component system nitrogen regulation response regulator GlnG